MSRCQALLASYKGRAVRVQTSTRSFLWFACAYGFGLIHCLASMLLDSQGCQDVAAWNASSRLHLHHTFTRSLYEYSVILLFENGYRYPYLERLFSQWSLHPSIFSWDSTLKGCGSRTPLAIAKSTQKPTWPIHHCAGRIHAQQAKSSVIHAGDAPFKLVDPWYKSQRYSGTTVHVYIVRGTGACHWKELTAAWDMLVLVLYQ